MIGQVSREIDHQASQRFVLCAVNEEKREKGVQVGGSVGHEIRAVTLKTVTENVQLMMKFEPFSES